MRIAISIGALLTFASTVSAADAPAVLDPDWVHAFVTKPTPIKGLERWTVDSRAQRGLLHDAALSPDGTRLAAWCADRTLRIWQVPTAKLLAASPLPGMPSPWGQLK